MVSTSPQACLTALVVAAAFWAMFATDAVGQGEPHTSPGRAATVDQQRGNWALNRLSVEQWQADPSEPLLPPSYIKWVESARVDRDFREPARRRLGARRTVQPRSVARHTGVHPTRRVPARS